MTLQLKSSFPIFSKPRGKNPLIYLDSAATTQKPEAVLRTMDRFYREEYATVHRAVYDLSQSASLRYYQVRQKVQKFLNAAETEEIIFTRGTTESLNLLAECLTSCFTMSGDRIALPVTEHHSNFLPWQMAAKKRGLYLDIIPIDREGNLSIDALEKILRLKPKILTLAHMTNTSGKIYPIEEIIQRAHAMGTLVVIDAAQSAAHLPMDVQKWEADFLVFSSHKIYGPTGIGVLYGQRKWLEMMPPYQGGGDMVDEMGMEASTYQPLPLKFEAGTPSIVEVIGLGAAIDWLESVGWEARHAHEKKLLSCLEGELRKIPGISLLGSSDQRGPLITFQMAGVHPLDLASWLSLQGICVRSGHLCAQLGMKALGASHATRASLGLYNDLSDIETFTQALTAAPRVLSR